MPQYTFYQVDVFTDTPFGGNPLAVFPDATGLDKATMQAIAREMNLSETTFVFPADDSTADYKVRIFTPQAELPFAGHPVVGTHWVLANLGRVYLREPVTTVKFQLGVGVRAAKLHVKNEEVEFVLMDHQKPAFYDTASPNQIERLARALGLAPEAILDTGLPVQVVSSGLKQLFVPVRALKDVEVLYPGSQDAALIGEVCDELDSAVDTIMVLTCETVSQEANVHTRLFAPNIGVPEDPATGSASGGLGAYLVEHRVIPATPPITHIVSEQGLEMGRPSRIQIEVDGEPGAISMVRVGGQVVPLIEGTLRW